MSKRYTLWSSLATAKLIASIGFQDMAFEANRRIDLDRGDEVRRSYSTMDRSDPADARMEVSVWLKATALTVSVEVGQLRVCSGVELGRERSYIEITLDAAAKVGCVR